MFKKQLDSFRSLFANAAGLCIRAHHIFIRNKRADGFFIQLLDQFQFRNNGFFCFAAVASGEKKNGKKQHKYEKGLLVR